jgi:uncharacterized protein (TIGR02246 family)
MIRGVSPRATKAESGRQVRSLYRSLLAGWNERDAGGMADLFAADGHLIGFDGLQIEGRADIETHLNQVFLNHPTSTYVSKVRGVQFISDDVALLRAVAGMVPPGRTDINSAANAVQNLVAVRKPDHWRIALFQNTPAVYHGRAHLVDKLTEELRQAMKQTHGRSRR